MLISRPWRYVSVAPMLKGWKQAAPWSSLASQARRMVSSRFSERCLQTRWIIIKESKNLGFIWLEVSKEKNSSGRSLDLSLVYIVVGIQRNHCVVKILEWTAVFRSTLTLKHPLGKHWLFWRRGIAAISWLFGHKMTQAHLRLLSYCALQKTPSEGLESWGHVMLSFSKTCRLD